MCGQRSSDDATLQISDKSNYHGKLCSMEELGSKPFKGRRFAIIKETLGKTVPLFGSSSGLNHIVRLSRIFRHFIDDAAGSGVDKQVVERIIEASKHMEELGVSFMVLLHARAP